MEDTSIVGIVLGWLAIQLLFVLGRIGLISSPSRFAHQFELADPFCTIPLIRPIFRIQQFWFASIREPRGRPTQLEAPGRKIPLRVRSIFSFASPSTARLQPIPR